jgi:glycosyltransferase involved in cell wall biosynthesis
MRLVVVIASAGRRDALGQTLRHLAQQSRRPDEVVLALSEQADAPALDGIGLPVHVVLSGRGLCVQRNAALAAVLPRADVVTFFDDDFLAAPSYLARLEAAFLANPDFSVVHGRVVADGITSAGFSFEQGVALLETALAAEEPPFTVRDNPGAYGCNMSYRSAHIGDARFDERLALYGWQEDTDFSARVGRAGRIVNLSSLVGVHLGIKRGRVSGVRLGYSQIVNPLYLFRKGSIGPRYAAWLISRNLLANIAKALWPEPWVDRRGRLYGNALAVAHVLRGRLEPERILAI